MTYANSYLGYPNVSRPGFLGPAGAGPAPEVRRYHGTDQTGLLAHREPSETFMVAAFHGPLPGYPNLLTLPNHPAPRPGAARSNRPLAARETRRP
jgi:hypothetical protein